MSHCVRKGRYGASTYKRHKYKKGVCKFCGVKQSEQLHQLAIRREQRKAAKILGRTAQ